MRYPVIGVLLICLMAVAARAEPPFEDLSFDAALARAKSEDKVVMVDFFTTWCGPCKKLDQTTWKDKAVQSWLEERTIALKIDAEKERALAAKYKVRAFPTMLFIDPDGSVVGTITGYHDAKTFIAVASRRIEGISELDEAKKTFEAADPNDLNARMTFGNALAGAGKYAEAFEQYDWLWRNGLSISPGYIGVRSSFLLARIENLAQQYRPAGQAMQAWYQEADAKLRSGDADRVTAVDFLALARVGKVPTKNIIEVCKAYEARKDARPDVKAALQSGLRAVYFRAGMYADFLGTFTKGPLPYVEKLAADVRAPMSLDGADPKLIDAMRSARQRALIGGGKRIYQALLATDQAATAAAVARVLLETTPSEDALNELKSAAARVNKADVGDALTLPENPRG